MENSSSLRLPRDQPVALAPGCYAEIGVEAGTVWLTYPGGGDIFLLSGQRHPLTAPGKAVIEAVFGDAQVTLHALCQRYRPSPKKIAGLSSAC